MRALIERLASGVGTYTMPEAKISTDHIALELEVGAEVCGEIDVVATNGLDVKGIAFSSNEHMALENSQFYGSKGRITYKASGKNLLEGEKCDGNISIVTTAGDFIVPFSITISKWIPKSSMGEIKDLDDFVCLVKQSYDEALIMFLSSKFCGYFLKDDSHAYTLYREVMKNTNRDVALEEFLIGMGLKKRACVSIADCHREYSDITQNRGDVVNIEKSTWGYVCIDVKVEGDFFYGCAKSVGGGDFNGRMAEYRYFINAARLHAGKNHGRIIFETALGTLTYDVLITNPKPDVTGYIKEKTYRIDLFKNYLEMCVGEIKPEKWAEKTSAMADLKLKGDDKNQTAILSKAYAALISGNTDKAGEFLNEAAGIMTPKDSVDVDVYCFYLYLRSLYKKDADFTEDILKEIRLYFDNGGGTWTLMWILFHMDERYEENPALKYTMAKRMFEDGCRSPILYYESSKIIKEQPELLRVLNGFEAQVLNFMGRYHMADRDVAEQAVYLISKETKFSKLYFRILNNFYEDTKLKSVLSCMCSMIICAGLCDKEYFKFIKEGVKYELNITNLYEQYIYMSNMDDYTMFDMSVYKYFSYGTDTLAYGRDYFFANLVSNFKKQDTVYKRCQKDMEEYAKSRLLLGENNVHLSKVYKSLYSSPLGAKDLKGDIFKADHTYHIVADSENITYVVLRHKEKSSEQVVPLSQKSAYVNIYTKDPVILFIDKKGRYLSLESYTMERMDVGGLEDINAFDDFTLLSCIGDIMEDPKANRGCGSDLLKAESIAGLSDQFTGKLREFTVNYYHLGYANDMGMGVSRAMMEKMSDESKHKVIELLIREGCLMEAYTYVTKYGYEDIDEKLLEDLCIFLVREDLDEIELVSEMCAKAFRNGCRNSKVLRFLADHYESSSKELYEIFKAMKDRDINPGNMAEKLLVQYLFEGFANDRLYEVYEAYMNEVTTSTIRKAFYTYISFNYFIKDIKCQKEMWDFLSGELERGFVVPIICKIAFLEVLSKKDDLSEVQIDIARKLIGELTGDNVNLEFYKKFGRYFKLPESLSDKTIIDYRSNPANSFDIEYNIKTRDGITTSTLTPMISAYPGMFTKEVVLFYGDEIDYRIIERSLDSPNGKVVKSGTIKASKEDICSEEGRFGLINGMLISRDLEREDAKKDMMQSYELNKEAGKRLFKLL